MKIVISYSPTLDWNQTWWADISVFVVLYSQCDVWWKDKKIKTSKRLILECPHRSLFDASFESSSNLEKNTLLAAPHKTTPLKLFSFLFPWISEHTIDVGQRGSSWSPTSSTHFILFYDNDWWFSSFHFCNFDNKRALARIKPQENNVKKAALNLNIA